MLNKFYNFLRKQSFSKKIVAFFGALGVIVSTVLTINQLVTSLYGDKEKEYSAPQVIAKGDSNIDSKTTKERARNNLSK